ncbi:MAG: hypothetical protein V4671_08300 [Armatimonadota bacterium]
MAFCAQKTPDASLLVPNGEERLSDAAPHTTPATSRFFLCLQATPPAVRPRMGGVPPSPRDPPFVA